MTLPIAMLRPAPEPPTAAGGAEPAPRPDDARSFGRALDHAMHESPGAARDAATTRRARATRARTAVNDPMRASRNDAMRDTPHEARRDVARDAARGDDDHMESDPARDRAALEGREVSRERGDARAEAARGDRRHGDDHAERGELSTMPVDGPSRGAREGEADEARQAHDGSNDSLPGGPATGELPADIAAPAPSPSSGEPHDPWGGTIADGFVERALASDAAFVAHVLGASPTTGPAARADAGDGRGVRGARGPASPMPGHEGINAAAQASVIALSRAAEEGEATATRAAATVATTARDPHSIRRDMDGLDPALRTRLERVVDRMEQEYGYTVEVVETLRTQERQDALYAQGRTASGPVVTWTRQSKHLHGAAADVVIDGGWTNAAGFERLARVAREEGLRTLWPRDPGHIELPNAAMPAGDGARTTRPAAVASPAASVPASDATNGAAAAIPRAARAAIDPAVGRTAPAWPAQPPGDVHTLPILPIGPEQPHGPEAGEVHTLPFEMPDVQLPTGEADMRHLPLGADRPVTTPVAGRRRLSAEPIGAPVRGDANPAVQVPTSGVARVAAVAQVAQVAPVAPVAQVATVARVAAVGGGMGPVRAEAAAPRAIDGALDAAPPPAPLPGAILAAPVIASDGRGGRGAGLDRRTPDESPERERLDAVVTTSGALPERDATSMPGLGRGEVAFARGERGDTAAVGGLTRSDATERIARVLRLQEASHDRPMTSVLLRLDHPEGGEDRIRIDLRGQTVGTTLDIGDARAAEQLRAHAPELQQALQRQGLEGESLVVRTNGRSTTDASALTASALAGERDVARAASATASDGGGSTARDTRNQPRAGHDRDGSDQQRSRQRRDGKGDTR